MQVLDNPAGNYRFLSGGFPYSSGVMAAPGYEIVHVTLDMPIPYQQGFELIDQHLSALGRSRSALCAIELRSPAPFSFEGFMEFNKSYVAILTAWGLLVDEHNPVARTNVAPIVEPPARPALYAFSYTVPHSMSERPSFVVSGAGDLDADGATIIRAGETSPAAMQEKAAFVMNIMQERLTALQVGWNHVTAVDIYTIQGLQSFLAPTILEQMGPAAVHGIRWFYSYPPIAGLEFEMDLRGIRQEIRL